MMNANCGVPLINPANSDGRYFYETGRDGAFQVPINNVPAADWVLFEDRSRIARQPCWLTFLHAAIPDQDSPVYVLLYDVNPDTNNIDALVISGMPARYSLGPVQATGIGGTIIYESEAEEVPCRVDPRKYPHGPPTVKGLPFNFGILAFASTTPRFYTSAGELVTLQMALTARMQA